MLVEVIQLRSTGMKLAPEEVAAAQRYVGNLSISPDGCASLHRGEQVHLTQTHLLPSLFGARLVTLKGDDFMLAGRQMASAYSGEMHAQAWWCRCLRGDHVPDKGFETWGGLPPTPDAR